MKSVVLCMLLWLFNGAVIHTVNAQEIELVRHIHFGNIVVKDNTSQGYIDIDALGNISHSHHFLVISPGHPGEILLTEFAPSAEIYVSARITQPRTTSTKVSPESFELAGVNVSNVVVTEGNGSAEITFGGTLLNSGSSRGHYADTDYTMRLRLLFQY